MKIISFLFFLFIFSHALAGRGYLLKGKLLAYDQQGIVLQQEKGPKVRLRYEETNYAADGNLSAEVGKPFTVLVTEQTWKKAQPKAK